MNRVIKFRVWDRALNKMITKENVKGLLDTVNTGDYYTDYTYSAEEWYPAYDILTIFDYFEDIQDRYIEDTSTKRFELMQYTGFHDKNGKEIYEGDIVEYENFWEADFEYKSGIAVIRWDNENTGFYGECQGYHYELDLFNLAENLFPEIIGNEYDNPELVEGENK